MFSVYQRSFYKIRKQITTAWLITSWNTKVYIKDRFIKFESKSQQFLVSSCLLRSVYQRSFYKIRKQITTIVALVLGIHLVYIKDRFIKFERSAT